MYELSMDYLSFDVRTEMKYVKPNRFNVLLIRLNDYGLSQLNVTKMSENRKSKNRKKK